MNPRCDVRRPYRWRGMVAALLAALLLAAAALPAAAADEGTLTPGGPAIVPGGPTVAQPAVGRENPILDSATPCGGNDALQPNDEVLHDLFAPSPQTNTRLPQTAVRPEVLISRYSPIIDLSPNSGGMGRVGTFIARGIKPRGKVVLLLSVPGEKTKQTIVVDANTESIVGYIEFTEVKFVVPPLPTTQGLIVEVYYVDPNCPQDYLYVDTIP